MRIHFQTGFALAGLVLAACVAAAAAEPARSNYPNVVRPFAAARGTTVPSSTTRIDLRGLIKGYHTGAGTSLVVTDDYSNYIWQMNAGGTKILGYLTDCSGPEGAKVDHNGN